MGVLMQCSKSIAAALADALPSTALSAMSTASALTSERPSDEARNAARRLRGIPE